LDFTAYQKKAHSTAIYPKIFVLKNPQDYGACISIGVELVDLSWVYPILGGMGEFGELCNKLKKVIRDDGFIITDAKRDEIIDEAGDGYWYSAEFATSLNMLMNKIAKNNLKKLLNRKSKNLIKGSGDKR
jgi:hypothetical protein